MKQIDTAVIGAGLTGLCAVRELLNAGHRLVGAEPGLVPAHLFQEPYSDNADRDKTLVTAG